jgi:hypothetical protein
VDEPSISNARNETLQPQAVISMGDKSAKAKKQDAADKSQKKAAAVANASQGSAGAAKKAGKLVGAGSWPELFAHSGAITVDLTGASHQNQSDRARVNLED